MLKEIDVISLLLLSCARNSYKVFNNIKPKIGDWVYEASDISSPFIDPVKYNPLDHYGILTEIGEYGCYTIRTIDGRETKWYNADFQVIPCADFLKKYLERLNYE
jgi:hypothetical protein